MTGHDALEVPGHAFISYVHEDASRVKRLVRILEASRIKVWQDTADILPGQDWKNAIKAAIKPAASHSSHAFPKTASSARRHTKTRS